MTATKIYSVGFNHDAAFDADHCKRIKQSIDLENFGNTGFSITAESEWWFLHQPKSDQIATHQSLPQQIYTLLLLEVEH